MPRGAIVSAQQFTIDQPNKSAGKLWGRGDEAEDTLARIGTTAQAHDQRLSWLFHSRLIEEEGARLDVPRTQRTIA